jgi:hypothetical protein
VSYGKRNICVGSRITKKAKIEQTPYLEERISENIAVCTIRQRIAAKEYVAHSSVRGGFI